MACTKEALVVILAMCWIVKWVLVLVLKRMMTKILVLWVSMFLALSMVPLAEKQQWPVMATMDPHWTLQHLAPLCLLHSIPKPLPQYYTSAAHLLRAHALAPLPPQAPDASYPQSPPLGPGSALDASHTLATPPPPPHPHPPSPLRRASVPSLEATHLLYTGPRSAASPPTAWPPPPLPSAATCAPGR